MVAWFTAAVTLRGEMQIVCIYRQTR